MQHQCRLKHGVSCQHLWPLYCFSIFRALCKDMEWLNIIKNIVDVHVPDTNWADLNEDVKEILTDDTFNYFGCVSHHHGSISELRNCIKLCDDEDDE